MDQIVQSAARNAIDDPSSRRVERSERRSSSNADNGSALEWLVFAAPLFADMRILWPLKIDW